MKALILSLVIAFSSSFALACNKPDASFGSREGAFTRPIQLQQNSSPVITVQGKQGKRTT